MPQLTEQEQANHHVSSHMKKKKIENLLNKIHTQRLHNTKKKQQRFNLEDEDENYAKQDNEQLTHLGKPVNNLITKELNGTSQGDGDTEFVSLNNKQMMNLIKNGKTLDEILKEANLPQKHENKTKYQITQENVLRSRYNKLVKQLKLHDIVDATNQTDEQFAKVRDLLKPLQSKSKQHSNSKNDLSSDTANDSLYFGITEEELRSDSRHKADRVQMSASEKVEQLYAELEKLEKRREKNTLDAGSDVSENEKEEEMKHQIEMDDTLSKAQKKKALRKIEKKFAKKKESRKNDKKNKKKDNDNDNDDDDDDDDDDDNEMNKKEKKKVVGGDKMNLNKSATNNNDLKQLHAMETAFEMAEQNSEDSSNDSESAEENDDFELIKKYQHPKRGVTADEDGANNGEENELSESDSSIEMYDIRDDGDMKELDFEVDERYMPKKKKLKVEIMNEDDIDKDDEDEEMTDKKADGEDGQNDDDENDEEDSEFEGAILKAEPVGDEQSVLETMRMKEELQAQQLKKQNAELKKESTKDWDEIDIQTIKKPVDNLKQKEWDLLNLHGKDDIIGEPNLKNVPFLLTIPETIEDFEELILDKTPEEQLTLFKRMRGTNHVRLQPENRGKMIRLYDMLMEHFKLLCTHFEPRKNTSDLANVSFYQYVDVIVRTLFALSHDIPDYAYQCHKNKLTNICVHLNNYYDTKSNQHLFSPSISNSAVGSENKTETSYMPSGYLLFYLKAISHIFPKDSKNNNITACVLLMLNKIITQIPVQGSRDMLCYAYCIQLILEVVENKQRYVPEVARGLYNMLRAGFMTDAELVKTQFDLLKETDDLYFTFKPGCNIWNTLTKDETESEKNTSESLQKLPIRWVFLKSNDQSDVFETRDFKLQLLHATLSLVEHCHKIWKKLLAYAEVFAPFLNLLSTRESALLSYSNGREFAHFYQNLFKQIYHTLITQSLCRKPLHSIRRRIPLQMLDPEFDPDLKPTFLRLKVRNEKHLEKKKLRLLRKAKRKQERSLMRELTRDTQFIMAERVKRKKEHEAKTKAKWVHEYQHLMEQARDTNAFQMVGKKLKKKMVKQGVIRGF